MVRVKRDTPDFKKAYGEAVKYSISKHTRNWILNARKEDLNDFMKNNNNGVTTDDYPEIQTNEKLQEYALRYLSLSLTFYLSLSHSLSVTH